MYQYVVLISSAVSDPSDQELCDALANMVAAVLACQPHSSHLWYHMFEADKLRETYITGFLVCMGVCIPCSLEMIVIA